MPLGPYSFACGTRAGERISDATNRTAEETKEAADRFWNGPREQRRNATRDQIELLTDSLDDALANASAIAPNFAGGYGVADNYVIRGLPMRFLRDGLPDGPSFMGYRRTLSDVAEIEVLKGPGSALYGAEAYAGVINIITRTGAQINDAEVVLMDIRMPQMTGIELARHLNKLEQPPVIIFTTAYDSHALGLYMAMLLPPFKGAP